MGENKQLSLPEYVEHLLKQGKRSQHPDFQDLMNVFGRAKITKIAEDILQKEKDAKARHKV